MKSATLTLTKNPEAQPWAGLVPLKLTLCEILGEGQVKEISSVEVFSGLPGAQVFRRSYESISGSAEPCPEGRYLLGDHDSGDTRVNWAGGRGNWTARYDKIYSPVWVGIHPAPETKMHPTSPRSAMGIHFDAGVPGTIGCVGTPNMKDLQKIIYWFENWKIRDMWVLYGLGLKFPFRSVSEEPETYSKLKIYWHPNGGPSITLDGKSQNRVHIALELEEGKVLAGKINGRLFNPKDLRAGSIEITYK